MGATDARPVPKKNVAYRHYFAIRKNDGTLITTWAGMDSEIALDGANFADCTNEATEIQTSGCGYIDLTLTEMNADCIALKITVTNTDALTYVVNIFPEEAGDIRADATQISGDATAADNLELQYDGTGYVDDTAPATQAQIGNLTSGTAAINATAASFTKVGAEPETNTYTSTIALDGTYHIVEDDAGSTDVYYEFNVGGNGVPVRVTWEGYAQSNGDSYKIYARNFGSSTWEQIGIIDGANGTTIRKEAFDLTIAQVGTGTDVGKVRFRIESSNGTAFATDRLLCSYSVISQSVGYADGAVWINTVSGVSGTTEYLHGTADNPVDNIADAFDIATALNLTRFHIANGSSITLEEDSSNRSFFGIEWTLALASQNIANSYFSGAIVTGINTGVNYRFVDCKVGAVTLVNGGFDHCALTSTAMVLSAASTYLMDRCFSGISGTDTPVIDFGAAVGNTQLNMRHYSGGIKIKNFKAGDTMSLETDGQIIIDSTCSGGTIAVRGHCTVSGDATAIAAITWSDDARYDVDQISDAVWNTLLTGSTYNISSSAGRRLRTISDLSTRQETAQGAGTGNNQIQLDTNASAVNGAYDPSLIAIVNGTGAGQSRLILQYNGTTKTATVDRNWKINPDATSEFVIFAHAGREHVNEGLLQAATSTTITLNTLASSSDDAYRNQMVFIRSGTGEDQVRRVISYIGATKVATVSRVWAVTPDATSGYSMLPSTCVEMQAIVDTELSAKDGENFHTFFDNSDTVSIITLADILSLVNLAEQDFYIDKTQVPYELVIHKKGDTGTELMRKQLFDIDGGNITSTGTIVGKHVHV